MMPSNFSDFKIDHVGERCTLITYLLFVLLSTLIGDTIILIASVRYNAIKLNKFIVAVMQHIAVSDLLRSVSFVLPVLASLIFNSRILGTIPGYIVNILNVVSYGSGNIFISLLTTSKLAIIKFPLKTRGWTERVAHVICASIWLSQILFHTLFLVLSKHVLFFGYIEYTVTIFLLTPFARNVFYWYYVFSSIIPTFAVVLATVAILSHLFNVRKVSRRTGGSVRWQGIAAVSTTATLPHLPAAGFLAFSRSSCIFSLRS